MAKFFDKLKDLIFESEEEEVPPRRVEVAPDIPFSNIKASENGISKVETVTTVSAPKPLSENKTDFVTLPTNKPQPVKPQIAKPVVSPKQAMEASTYQFTKVISPIFGPKDEIKTKGGKPVVVPPVTKSINKSPLGTIISPMFGVVNDRVEQEVPEELEQMSVEDILNEELDDTVIDDTNIDKTPSSNFEKKNDDTENLSLFDDEEQ